MGGTGNPRAELPTLVSSLSPEGRPKCPGPLSFALAAVSHDMLRSADAETIAAALQGPGLAADGMQAALVQGGPRMRPREFSLGFYKSARKTATFMLRCHSQGPTQDQLLADFDSLSWNLGSPSPNWDTGTLGFWCFSLSFSFFFLVSLLIPMQPFPY